MGDTGAAEGASGGEKVAGLGISSCVFLWGHRRTSRVPANTVMSLHGAEIIKVVERINSPGFTCAPRRVNYFLTEHK